MNTVTVRVPATPQYVQVVRLIAAGLGARLGFTLEEIDDLKIAVDELTAYLTTARGRNSTLEIDFDIEGDRLQIRGAVELAVDAKGRTELTDLSQMILDTVVESASLRREDSSLTFSLSKGRALSAGARDQGAR